ncbi:MAG: CGP-CTERM sorting domain-containing protein, partial [Thermococcus sp.]|nr:CGP-CTERM sorting domain-containing protein [Thermococcus sp.]
TWGTALALLGVEPAHAPATTTTSTTTTTTTSTSSGGTSSGGSGTSTTSSSGDEGICGPALIVALAAIPLLMRKRR